MRLEDAFLFLELKTGRERSGRAPEVCEAAIAGGADVVCVTVEREGTDTAAADEASIDREAALNVRKVCRRDDALFLVRNSGETAAAMEADGLHLDDPAMPVAMMRTQMGGDGVVGVEAQTADLVRLALAVGADYVVHKGGTRCGAVFEGLRDAARVPLFAGGFCGVEEVREFLETGVYRLAIEWDMNTEGDVREGVAAFSRLLGRCV